MEEKDILLLESLGYSFSESGAIVDKDGNYTSSVNYNDRLIESPASLEEYNSELAQKQYLQDIDFQSSDESIQPNRVQEKTAIALDQIKKFEENPLYNNLPYDATDTVYKDAYNQYKEEKINQGEFVHDSYEDFVQQMDNSEYLDLETDEERQQLKNINKRIDEIEKIDPDNDKSLEFAGDESKGYILSNIGGLPSVIAKPGEDANIFEKGFFETADFLNDTVNSIISTFSPTGAGMKDEKLQQEYKQLVEERRTIMKPVAEKRIAEVEVLENEILEKQKEVDYFSNDYDKYAYALQKLHLKKNELNSFVDDTEWYRIDKHIGQVLDPVNVLDWASLGLYEAYASYNYRAGLRKKIDNNEELTAADIELGKVFSKEEEIASNNFQQNFTNEIVAGTNESLKFLGFGAGGRTVAKGATKALARKGIGKFTQQATSLGVQTVLHPTSYINASDYYAGSFELVENEKGSIEILAGERLYQDQKRENLLLVNELDNAIDIETDENKIKDLQKQKEEILKFDNSLKEPVSGLGALTYGYTEMLKEVAAENYGGKLFNKIGGDKVQSVLGKALNKIPGARNLNRMTSKGKDLLNAKLGGIPGEKVIGSNTEEIFEEMLVQLTPTYGNTLEENIDQAKELLTLDFYTKVAAQTLLMQKVVGLGNTPAKIKSYLNKDQRQKRKEMKELYKQLGSRHIKQEDFNQAMMKAGNGNFSIQEYNNEIKAMKDAGLVVEANELERTKILKQALQAEKDGQLNQFVKAMTKAKYNKNLSPETKANIETLIPQLKDLDDTPYINRTEIINLKSKKSFAEKSKNDISEKLSNLPISEITEEFDKIKENLNTNIDVSNFTSNTEALNYLADNFDSLSDTMQQYVLLKKQDFDNNKNVDNISKEIKNKTSYDHQMKLELEQDYLKHLNSINNQLFKGKITPSQFKKLTEVKSIQRRTKGIPKQDIERIHKLTLNELESQQERKIINNTSDEEVEDNSSDTETVSTNNPSSDVPHRTANVINTLNTVANDQSESIQKNNDLDIEDQSIDFLPASDNTVNQLSSWAESFKQEENSEPTFTDFFNDAVTQIGKKSITRDTLETLGDAFEKAGLGKSNWEQVYNDNYVDRKKIAKNAVFSAITDLDNTTNETSIEENKQTVDDTQLNSQPVKAIEPSTSQPIRVTPVAGKTSIISTKANFRGVEYKDEVIQTNGKVVLTKRNSETIPILNENSIVNVKELLNPNKNNPGDVWNAEILDESEWSTIPVSNGETRTFTNFQDWIDKNKPSSMTLEEFKKTDEFISKIPIVYKSNNGEILSFIPDTDWYNTFNVKDPSKEIGDTQNLDNPSPSHKALIQKGKNNTLELRKQVLSGQIKQVEILTKSGSPVDFYPVGSKLPTLDKVGTTYPIAFMKGDQIVDLNGKQFGDDVEITNKSKLKKAAQKNINQTNRTMILIPVNTINGKKKYVAYKTMAFNENGEAKAFNEDIDTAKFITAAHLRLSFGNDASALKNSNIQISIAEAKAIQSQIKEQSGIDIANFNNATELVKGMVIFNYEGGKYTIDGNVKTKDGNKKVTTLMMSGQGYFTQNTSLSEDRKKAPLKISKENGQFKVDKIADTYEQYLRSRLSTEIVHHNIGTQEKPLWTAHIQPVIELKPIQTQLESISIGESTVANPVKEEQRQQEEVLDEIKDAEQLLRDFGMIDSDELFDDLLPTLNDVTEIEKSLKTISNLTLSQQRDVTSHILSYIANNYDNSKKLLLSDFKKLINNEFNNDINEKLNQVNDTISSLSTIQNNNPSVRISDLLTQLNKTKDIIDTIKDNSDDFFNQAYLESMRKGFIPSTIKTEDELKSELNNSIEDEMYQKDYSKSSNEVIHKDKISKKLRRLFATIDTGKKGFLGLPKHESYDVMYNTISAIIVSDLPTNPDFDSMINKLNTYKKSYPWLNNFISELDKADNDTKNAFVYNMYKYAAKAKFVIFTKHKDGINSELWNSNANNIKRKIKESWNNNFKRSNITNGNTLNTKKLTSLWDQYESWGDEPWNTDHNELKQWLNDFGIVLSEKSWDDLVQGKMLVGTGKNKVTLGFDDLFFVSGRKRNNRLFSNLALFAKEHKDTEQGKLDYIQNANLHPFKDMGSILPSLINIESEHNAELQPQTRRDGGKSVSEMIFPTFFFHNIAKLKRDAFTENQEYIETLKSIPFSETSLTLELLQSSDQFKDIFDYAEVGLQSLDEQFKKSNPFGKIDQISPIDLMFHQRNQFQYMKTEKLNEQIQGVDMRVGTMSTLTNSDKGRMMLKKTAVFDFFTGDNISLSDDKVLISDNVKNIIYTRLIEPELKRIVNHVDSNIKDYDKSAKRFNLIPELNLVEVDGISAIDYLKSSSDIEGFKELYFEKLVDVIKNNIVNESTKNIQQQSEFIIDGIDMFNNKDYINDVRKKGSPETKQLLAEIDFVLNSYISNIDTLQTISGDPAMFYKSKSIDNVKQSQDLGVNLGKRMAMMIAPGNVLSNSTNESYIQLFLEDQEEVASNIEEIIGWHYSKSSLKETYNNKTYQDLIDELRNKTISDTDLNQLKLKFAKVKDFLTIETTDAQEYTTIREHLRVLEGSGRLNSEKKKDILDKVENNIPLSKSDIDLVLQPVKPVYTGDVIEPKLEKNGTVLRSAKRRIMYIKSSSFPLIPELVKGTKLESLMNKMEQIEKDNNTTVRASYQSANKVGAINTPINPFNEESLNNADALDPDTGQLANALVLDRINFKIQQDVPFKSDYQKEDHVSMGTQIFKLLFGDGITNIDGFEYNGEKYNGKELQKEFFDIFSSIINIQKENLLSNLGLNNDFTTDDSKYTAEKIQELLKSEAEERGFSQNDLKSLAIEKKTINGQEKYHFKLPLWFSANSNKLESMLNAIINNKIFKQKLPGNGFVVGSEAGLTLQEGIGNIETNRILKIGDYKGGELKGTEVLAPSKIKLNGKLVNLFEKTKQGDYKYLLEDENGLTINPEKIDPDLVNNFVFRTPTSSHGSGSAIKIVGFLPDVMGDLMITPKNFVTQMGQDFDIDKLTAYQHYHIENDGRIEKLNEVHKEIAIEKLKQSEHIDSKYDEIASEFLEQFADSELLEILNNTDDTLDEKINKLSRNFDIKIAKNKFIDIHNSIYNNNSAKVQSKINKVLSMEIAENQADAITELNELSNDISFNILSPTYQMDKLISGSTGSAAIGIYAKGVTFNSMVQQNEFDIRVLGRNEDGYAERKSITIGNIKSDGQLGLQNTLSITDANNIEKALARKIAEAQDERVNTATDNEKAQILGRVGITNLEAVAVDNLLSLLGIDTEITQINKTNYDESNPFHKKAIINNEEVYYTQYSLPYLLHSQPIVKEYFKRLKNGNAIIKDLDSDLKEKIVEELIGNYQKVENANKSFTGEKLANEITTNNYVSDFQKEILLQYLELIDDSKALKELQDIVDMSNLGKSMWESKSKIQKFKSIIENETFENAETLLGTFSEIEGELDLGEGLFFTPTTNQGVMVGNAISLNRNLFYDYFPYYDPYIDKVMSDITNFAGNTGNEVQFQENVFQEMKKFITSATRNGLFLDTPSNERKSLFMDTDNNISLSSYISLLSTSTDENYKAGLKMIQNNSLLTYMSYEKGEDGKPSLIKFDNTEVANSSEEEFHDDFKELLIRDYALPPRNGKEYSTKKLAQELVAYSHLSGGIVRQAIEFHRFIPVEYYNSLINPQTNTTVTRALQNYDTIVSNWDEKKRLQNFTKQFFQNNPQYATQLPSKFRKDYVNITGNSMSINTAMEEYPMYISVKNSTKSKLKKDKWSVFENIGGNNYRKLDTLGEFGMSEYDYASTELNSIITSEKIATGGSVKVPQSINPIKNTNNKFGISNTDTVEDVLKNISNSSFGYNKNLPNIASKLLELFGDKLNNTSIKIDSNLPARGRYQNGIITINPKESKMAETFLHEFIHSISSDYLNNFYEVNNEGTFLTDTNGNLVLKNNIPVEIQKLNIVASEFKNKMKEQYPDEFKSFEEKYKLHKSGKPQTFSERETSLFYPTINLKEFLAVSLSNNNDFLTEASKIKYKNTGENILSKFAKLLNDLLSSISGIKNTLGEKILTQSFETLTVINKPSSIDQEVTGQELMDLSNEYNNQTPPDIDFSQDINDSDIDLLPDCI